MYKAGYKNAIQGTASVQIGLTDEGYIAQSDDVIASFKTFNFTTTNADNNLTQNESVTSLFVTTFLDGYFVDDTQSFKVTWNADL